MSYPTEDAAFFTWVEAKKLGKIIGAASGTLYANETKVTLAPTGGTIAITGSVVPVRGNLVVSAGDTVTAGYLYGVQGKITVKGTLNHPSSQYSAALVGQLDLSSAVALTAGTLSALWLDAGATSAVDPSTAVNMIQITNTTTKLVHSLIAIEADANYFLDVHDTGNNQQNYMPTKAIGTYSGKSLIIRDSSGGADHYIPLYNLT